ncbi:MAG: hypothetical protein ACREFV_05955, partial [Acetobacteraceae bacterium]
MPVLLAQAAAPTLAAPVVAAVQPIDVFILAGILGAGAGLLLVPLRLRPGQPKPAGRGKARGR